MRIAHFSDIHVTQFPLSGGFALKRLAAVASYTILGRRKRFAGSDARIAKLLEQVDGLGIDHAICTGDLTGVASPAEYARVAELFGERRSQPDRYTCIPGNHDCYIEGAESSFREHFGALAAGGEFPFEKDVGPVTIVGIQTARPTSVIDSSGLVGEEQLRKLGAILRSPRLRERFVILALHYGLVRGDGSRDKASHGLRDDLALVELLADPGVSVDLVLHGHIHRPFFVRAAGRPVVNVGSTTDLHVGCGFHVYSIEPEARRVAISRYEWSAEVGEYREAEGSPLAETFTTR